MSSVANLTSRGDELRKALDWSGALGLYLEAAGSVNKPEADLCLKIARCNEQLDCSSEAFRWLARVVETSDSFQHWAAAASLMGRMGTEHGPTVRRDVRVVLTGSYTTTQLGAMLRLAALPEGIEVHLCESDYGQYRQDIIDPASRLYGFGPDYVIIAVHEGAAELPTFSDSPADAVAAELDRWQSLWRLIADRARAHVVQHNFALRPEVALGHLSTRLRGCRYSMLQALNLSLGDQAGNSVSIVDCDRLASMLGKNAWFDDRYWYLSKQGVSLKALPMLARHTVAVLAGALGLHRKCLVLDLDNTVWGGVIGEDGLEGIKLGHGPEGEAFVAFQDYLLQLKNKGIVLAVASKNNEADVRRAFADHPDMRLRLEDIAILMCNWNDKAANLRSIANELNLGLDALALVDDNPAEGALVRQLLPEVDVITLPAEPSGYVQVLSAYLRFETNTLSAEDVGRTQQYRARAEAMKLASSSDAIEDFYRSLNMQAEVTAFDEFNLPRIAQLIGKTNQFNLTAHRYGLEELRAFAKNPDNIHLYLRLRDRFADHGLVSILMARRREQTVHIDAFLMSCRVIGRTVEAEMLMHLCRIAALMNCTSISGTYVPTGKNELVQDLYGRFGFDQASESHGTTVWEYDLIRRGPIQNGFIEPWHASYEAS